MDKNSVDPAHDEKTETTYLAYARLLFEFARTRFAPRVDLPSDANNHQLDHVRRKVEQCFPLPPPEPYLDPY